MSHGHFKCNRSKLSKIPVLWAYARDLIQTPGVGDTTDFVQIKQHYYIVHGDINSTGYRPLVPGPVRLVGASVRFSVPRRQQRKGLPRSPQSPKRSSPRLTLHSARYQVSGIST